MSTYFTELSSNSKKYFFEYPSKERENIMSAALKSALKRNDIFISEDLVKDHFTSPVNEKSVFLSSMKKKKKN